MNTREENSPANPAGIRTRNLLIMRPALLPTSYPGCQYVCSNQSGGESVTLGTGTLFCQPAGTKVLTSSSWGTPMQLAGHSNAIR